MKIDREKVKELLCKENYTVEDLREIVSFLRCEDGCPWDRVQTHESIRINMIEEAYELVDAINKKDDEKLKEEIGDVFMQVIFHTNLAEESGAFDFNDVVDGICKKLIYRHTHVFGNDTASDASEALRNWDKNKVTEKGFKNAGEYVSDVPQNFPALLRAEKVQKRAGKYGLDFSGVEEVYQKLDEEIVEFKEAKDEDGKIKEIGDILFTAVNLARLSGVEAENALSESTRKFEKRFIKAEELAIKDGKELKNLTKEEWDEYYNASKEY